MTTDRDPEWYIEAQRDHAEWAADIDACVQWLTSTAARDALVESDAGYIMVAAMSAYALHLHRVGGGGVVTCRYELLEGALVIVGRPSPEAPATLEEARARLVVAGQEIERLRAEVARLRWPSPDSLWRHFRGGEYVVDYVMDGIVHYHAEYTDKGGGEEWTRPLAEWHERVERDGYSGPRFVEIGVTRD